MKIYTKKGDKGTTSILNNVKYSKAHIRICAIGEIDELNAHMGMIYSQYKKSPSSLLFNIMNDLFVIGSCLANETINDPKSPKIEENSVKALELEIDHMNESLPPMTHFILPCGDPLTSQIHITRAVCRRAERAVALLNEQSSISEYILPFINRLSDYLFVLSRYYCFSQGIQETKWIPNQ